MLVVVLSLAAYVQVVLGSICLAENGDIVSQRLELPPAALNETAQLISIDQPWENFFIAAPAAVSLLGQISVMGGKKDFRLDERPPIGGFKYIRNPNSFRATMAQLSVDGWNCFHVAHRNMDAIQLNMAMIPRRVKTIVKVLEKSPVSMFQRMLRIPLNNIKDIGQLCVDKAQETRDEFGKIYNMLGEIVMTTESSRGVNDERLFNATVDKEMTTSLIKNVEEQQKMYKKNQEQLDEQVRKWEDDYKKALDAIPTGWKKIGMDFVDGVGKAFKGIVKDAGSALLGGVTAFSGMFGAAMGGGVRGMVSSFQHLTGAAGRSVPMSVEETFETGFLSHHMKMFAKVMVDLENAIANNNRQLEVYVAKLSPIKAMLQRKAEGSSHQLFNMLFEEGQAIAERSVQLTQGRENKLQGAEKTAIEGQLKKLQLQVDSLIQRSTPTGNQGAPPQITNSGDDSNERFNVQQASGMLKFYQQQKDANFAQFMKSYDALGELQARMARVDLERASFEEIIELIKESLTILRQIQYQWNLLTQFFSAMATRTEFAFNQTMKPFITTVSEGALQGPPLSTPEERQFLLDILSPIVRDIQITSHFLHTVSKTYVDISGKHILDQLSSMAGLSALPAEQRAGAIAELQRNAKIAEDAIFLSAKAKREAYNEALQSGRLLGSN